MAVKHPPYRSAQPPSPIDADVSIALQKMQQLSVNFEENEVRDFHDNGSSMQLKSSGPLNGGRRREVRNAARAPIESNAEVLYYLHHLQAKLQRGDQGASYGPGNGYSNRGTDSWEDLEFLEHGAGRGASQHHPGLPGREYSPSLHEPPCYRPSNFDTLSPHQPPPPRVSASVSETYSLLNYESHGPYTSPFERPQSHNDSRFIGRRLSLPSSRSPPPHLGDRQLRHHLSLDENIISHFAACERETEILSPAAWPPTNRRWTGGHPRPWSPPYTPLGEMYDALSQEDSEPHVPHGSLLGPPASQSPRSIVEAHFREARSELWGLETNQSMPPGKAFLPPGCGHPSLKLPPLHIPPHDAEDWTPGYIKGSGSHLDRLFEDYPTLSPGPNKSPRGKESDDDDTESPRGLSSLVSESQSQSQSQSQSSHNLYKTELCRSWEETGNCRYGAKCQFAHGQPDLRPVARHPKYKTEICRTFNTNGTCPYGTRCRFIHRSPPSPAIAMEKGVAPPPLVESATVAECDSSPNNASRSRLRIFRDICPADAQKASAMAA